MHLVVFLPSAGFLHLQYCIHSMTQTKPSGFPFFSPKRKTKISISKIFSCFTQYLTDDTKRSTTLKGNYGKETDLNTKQLTDGTGLLASIGSFSFESRKLATSIWLLFLVGMKRSPTILEGVCFLFFPMSFKQVNYFQQCNPPEDSTNATTEPVTDFCCCFKFENKLLKH